MLIHFEILAGRKCALISSIGQRTNARTLPAKERTSGCHQLFWKRQSLPFFMDYKVAIVNNVQITIWAYMFTLYVQETASHGWWGL
jgi:hypothetical protein